MPKQVIEAALANGWKPGYTIFSMLRTGVYFYVGDEEEATMSFQDIASEGPFWQAYGKSRGWSPQETETNAAEYARLVYHNKDILEFWDTI